MKPYIERNPMRPMRLNSPLQDSRERGSAALVAIATLLPLVIAGGTMLAVSVHHRTEFEASVAKRVAVDAAAAGAQDALAKLAADADFSGQYDLKVGGNQAVVSVTRWENDQIDNDGLNGVDDPAEADYVQIGSNAWVNDAYDSQGHRLNLTPSTYHSATDAIVKKLDQNVEVDQAVYIDDPASDVDFNGNAFLISGNDTNLDGTAGPSSPIPGIGVPGDPSGIIAQIKKNQKADVEGSGGTPSVGMVSAFDFVDKMDALAKASTITFNGPSDNFQGSLGDFSTLTPAIIHAKGDLTITGATQGCGYLIVDGDFVVNGSFDFAGVVFVKGAVKFMGGGGGKNVYGALMTLGAVEGTDLSINGSVDIRYSSQAIKTVEAKLANSYTLVSWVQK
jgi:hypothetical protein